MADTFSGSPCTANAWRTLSLISSSHSASPARSACAESALMTSTWARSGISSPKIFSVSRRSTIRRPSVFSAWKPTISTMLSGLDIPWRRWCRTRPPSHMPLAAMMIMGPGLSLSAIDSCGVPTNVMPGKVSGSVPAAIIRRASSL